MAEEIEKLVVRVAMDGAGFQNGVSKINRQLKLVQSDFKQASEKIGKFGSSTDKLKLKAGSLTRQIKLQKQSVSALRRSLQESIDKKGKDAKATQNLAIKTNKAKSSLAKMEGQLKETNSAIKEQSSRWNKLSQRLQKSGEKMKSVGQGMSQTGQALTRGVTLPIVGVGVAATKASIDFEEAFTGVRKTVDATEQQYAELSKGIRNMAKQIPASATEIAKVAESAGQLGIKKKDILGFTRTMIDLGNSTNLSSDQAATSLARLANITSMPQDQFDRLGSVVVDLGNNLATTESEIVEMGLHLAGAGKQVGMTEAQILSLAGALSSVGIKAEAGGSAFSKVMINMQLAAERGGKGLKNFAKVAGMSASDFKEAYEKDATGAILKFIKGLSTAEDRGMSAIKVLDDMGIKEVRMRDALLRAAGASGKFSDAVKIGSQAWKENTALTEEAGKRYNTTASQLKVFWNRIKDVGITLGDAFVPTLLDAVDAMDPFIDFIKGIAKGFSDLSKPTQRLVLGLAGVAAAIGPILIVTGPLVAGIGSLALAFAAAEVSMVAVLGPIGIVAGAIGALTVGVIAFTSSQSKSNDVSLKTASAMQKQHDQQAKMIDQLDALRTNSDLTNDQFGRYLDLQSRLKSETDPKAIKDIKDQMEKLRKRSDLSNDQFDRLIGLNKKITDKMPAATGTITEQGNRIADTTGALKRYNKELQNATERELQTKRLDAMKQQKEIQEEINKKEKAYQQNLNIEKSIREELRGWDQKSVDARKKQLNILIKQNAGQKGLVSKYQIELDQLNQGKQGLRNQLSTMIKKNDESKEQLDKLKKQEGKLDAINQKLKEIYLKNAGISDQKAEQNAKDGTALNLIRKTISKLNSEKKKIANNAAAQGHMTQEQRNTLNKIKDQIDKLKTARSNIKQNTNAAGKFTRELGADVIKNIKFTGDTESDAIRLNNALAKRVYKNVVVNVDMPAHTQLKLRGLFGYASGTGNYPGGVGLVGEEGPELVRLPKGSQIIPNDRTNEILSAMRDMPGLASGGEILRQGLALVGERGRELYRAPQTAPSAQSPDGGSINFYQTNNSPRPLSPSENARKAEQMLRRYGMEAGF